MRKVAVRNSTKMIFNASCTSGRVEMPETWAGSHLHLGIITIFI